MLGKHSHRHTCDYPLLTLVVVLGWGPPAAAEQTVRIEPDEKYVLVPNGAKRITDGNGNAQIFLDDKRVVRISRKGRVDVRDVNNKRVGYGKFVRWQALSRGRISIRRADIPNKRAPKGVQLDRHAGQYGGLKSSTNRQGARIAGARTSRQRDAKTKSPAPGKTNKAPLLQKRLDIGAQVLIYR